MRLSTGPEIAGATVRGDGKITLIVDVGAMMDMAKSIKVSFHLHAFSDFISLVVIFHAPIHRP